MARRDKIRVHRNTADDALGHQAKEGLLVRNVVVERARLDVERASYSPHGGELQPPGVENVERRGDDVVAIHGVTLPCSTHDAVQSRGVTWTFIRRRHCTQCRRRMKVQVTPRRWVATCVEHGSSV